MAEVIFMLYILKTWYTMPPTLPVLFTFFAFLALGVYAALGLKNKRSVLFLGLGLAVILDKFVVRKKKGFVPEMTKIITRAGEDEESDEEIEDDGLETD